MPAELTRQATAEAAAARSLGAAVLAAPAVESEASALHELVVQLTLELALGHAFSRAACAREGSR